MKHFQESFTVEKCFDFVLKVTWLLLAPIKDVLAIGTPRDAVVEIDEVRYFKNLRRGEEFR